MSDYFITQIAASDKRGNRLVDELLTSEGIRRDGNLDYTCGMYDDEMNLIATGSCFGNTLRCMAVSHEHQGEGLMNSIVSHLIELQFSRGNTHLFLYTKCDSARFFGDLGFYEIARINGQIVFMENKRTGFSGYLNTLEKQKEDAPRVAALVMNANPFTLGHQYLVEKAAAENDILHLLSAKMPAWFLLRCVRSWSWKALLVLQISVIMTAARTSSAMRLFQVISRRMQRL